MEKERSIGDISMLVPAPEENYFLPQDVIEHMERINELSKRLQEHKINLHLTDKTRDFLADAGFDPVYGARPLKRAIQQKLENRLAADLVAGKFSDGDKIKIDAQTHSFIIGKM